MKHLTNHFLFLFLFLSFISVKATNITDSNLRLRYSFNSQLTGTETVTDDSENGLTASLKNGASISLKGGINGVLDLGSTDGYLDLGSAFGSQLISSLEDFTISTYICIAQEATITNNGNFVFAFGNSDKIATDNNGCMFFSAKNGRYAITLTNWTAENGVATGSAMEKGKWKHLAITYSAASKTVKIYINGSIVATSANISISPKSLGTPTYNYLGKSSYALNGDAYLKNTLIDEFRIYDIAFTDTQIQELGASLTDLNTAWFQQQINSFFEKINFKDGQNINANLSLPTSDKGISITWASSDPNIISTNGVVTRPTFGSPIKSVILTATASKEGVTLTKNITLNVLPARTNNDAVAFDSENLSIKGNLQNLRTDVVLTKAGFEGSIISWASDVPNLLTNNGKLLYLPEKGTGPTKVVLTATITKGDASQIRRFEIYVAEKEGMSAYLFAYFTGNTQNQEALRFALSKDGYNFKALNNNNAILDSRIISSTGGIRDPHILRGADGNTFYMVATDMVSALGWNANRAMILMKSTNLTDWQTTVINIPTTFSEFSDAQRVWAPQTIYDAQKKKYMVYWSMSVGNGADKIYYSYTNDSFTALETTPKVLFANPNGTACIDADIVLKDGSYYLFFKTEGAGNGIKKAVSTNLTSGYTMIDKYLQSTTNAVEGGCVFRRYDTDNWMLIYDMYTSGAYQFTQSTDLDNFSVVTQPVVFDFTPRHGTIIPITTQEAAALEKKWGSLNDIYIQSSASDSIKKNNVSLNQTTNTIYLPVRQGTDISNFNPQFVATAGSSIQPSEAQNFANGAVNYTVSIDGLGSKTYTTSVEVANNPVLEGYYADPEILYSNKTKKFYIYPTSDGFLGWSGSYFKTFSSNNLVNWNDEGVILDLPKDVSWGTYNAWAPSIVEKKVNGAYKYYYYFVAAGNTGVAVANDPTGPFVDSGKQLASGIDPDVYNDTISGKSYLYWGNTTLYAAELNADMISINTTTKRTITPTDGTFREGVYIAYRQGIYYFFWSENDTRSADYRVRYGTSTSPLGPITIPTNNLVLSKNASAGIYGTGHNSVIQLPGKDEWYMVYHRFTRPKGITMQGDSAGFYREVCIDKLEFNANGSIKPVLPTVKGIQPVTISGVPSSIEQVVSDLKGNIVKKDYFQADGKRVKKKDLLNNSLYIERTTYDSGQTSSKKIIINN